MKFWLSIVLNPGLDGDQSNRPVQSRPCLPWIYSFGMKYSVGKCVYLYTSRTFHLATTFCAPVLFTEKTICSITTLRTLTNHILADIRLIMIFMWGYPAHNSGFPCNYTTLYYFTETKPSCCADTFNKLHPYPIKNRVVRLTHFAISFSGFVLVDIKGVKVLHEELLASHQPKFRLDLIPVLAGDLVQSEWKLLVRDGKQGGQKICCCFFMRL